MANRHVLKTIFCFPPPIFWVGLLGAVIFSCGLILSRTDFSRYFPIKTVRVYGLHHTNHQEVQNLVTSLVRHGFFTIDVERIKDRLLQMPWVAESSVRRIWPDQINIAVVENNPIAYWNEESLLSDTGKVFLPKSADHLPLLPKFNGPSGQHIEMLQCFNNINRLLLPLHAKISYLELTPYRTWKLTLSNGIKLQLGQKDTLIRLDRFVKVYPRIVGDHTEDVDYVDLRYPNGVAVRWKTGVKI